MVKKIFSVLLWLCGFGFFFLLVIGISMIVWGVKGLLVKLNDEKSVD